jgi:hypothetical protein
VLPHRPILVTVQAVAGPPNISPPRRGSRAPFTYHIQTVAAFVCVNIQHASGLARDMCAGNYRNPVILGLAQGR